MPDPVTPPPAVSPPPPVAPPPPVMPPAPVNPPSSIRRPTPAGDPVPTVGPVSVGIFFRLVTVVKELTAPQLLHLIALFLVVILVIRGELDRREVSQWRATSEEQSSKTREQLLTATWELASELRNLRAELKETRSEVRTLSKSQTDLFMKILQVQLKESLDKLKGLGSGIVERSIELLAGPEKAPAPRPSPPPAEHLSHR